MEVNWRGIAVAHDEVLVEASLEKVWELQTGVNSCEAERRTGRA